MMPFYDYISPSSKSGVWNMFPPVLTHVVLNGDLQWGWKTWSYLASKQILLPITLTRARRTRAILGGCGPITWLTNASMTFLVSQFSQYASPIQTLLQLCSTKPAAYRNWDTGLGLSWQIHWSWWSLVGEPFQCFLLLICWKNNPKAYVRIPFFLPPLIRQHS